MTNPLAYIRLHPKLGKQIIGLTLPQLEQLIKQAISKRTLRGRYKSRKKKRSRRAESSSE